MKDSIDERAETDENRGSGDVARFTTCSTAGPLSYDVKDGRILRVEPMEFQPDEVDPWSVVKNGHSFTPPLTHPVLPWGLASKQANYDYRVKYPLKRVDWDPKGERNTANRGVSAYERISWDETYEILADEIQRITEQYGSTAIAWGHSAHPEWGSFHYFFSDQYRFFHMIGATAWEPTPVSWEGWAIGAPFLWGSWGTFGLPAAPNSLQDCSQYSETVIFWGTDPLFKNVYAGIDMPRIMRFWKEIGKKVIVIEPFFNEMAAAFADKWIPIHPGTDGALACAIMYVWIQEGLYDQEYLDTHAVGFDEDHMPEGVPAGMSFKTYILGLADDQTPKTPEWAEEHCGVPARTIYDLARLWASAPTAYFGMLGGVTRREFADTTARLLGMLQIMQGIGKPGIGIIGGANFLTGPYDENSQVGPIGYADGGMNTLLDNYPMNVDPDLHIPYQRLLECLENPPQHWYGARFAAASPEEYFAEHSYPAEGCAELRMLWLRGSTFMNIPDIRREYRAFKNEQVDTFVVTAPWFDRTCRYADLVLPTTSLFEHEDITEPASIGVYSPAAYLSMRAAVYHRAGVEPQGESKTDMEICDELSKRLGYGDVYMEGNSMEDLLKKLYGRTTIPMEYDEFKEKGYYVWPDPKLTSEPRQFQAFCEDPENNPIDTPTGKFEIFSTLLYEHYGYNEEIPPVPHYIPEKEGHESAELKEDYPLSVVMAHPKFRFHGKYNRLSWLMDIYKVWVDGYPYEPIWMNPADAAARDLGEGDVVHVYNGRGEALAGVHITNRLMPGSVWFTYGSWHDPLNEGERFIDRAGDANILGNSGPMSVHHLGGACNSVLAQVRKADLEALKQQYPEGFAGKFSTWKWEAE